MASSQLPPPSPIRAPLLALLLLVPAPSVGAATALLIAPGPIGQAVYAVCKAWLLAFPLVWTFLVSRNRLTLSRPSAPAIGVGALLGLAIGAVIIAGYDLLVRFGPGIDASSFRNVAESAGFGSLTSYMLFGAYLALVNALLEEYVWRWFVFRACAQVMPSTVAVLAAALFFTLHHIIVLGSYFPAWLTAVAASGVFIGGCAWSWCYLRYKSVWPGYVSHIIVDAAILYVGWRMLFQR